MSKTGPQELQDLYQTSPRLKSPKRLDDSVLLLARQASKVERKRTRRAPGIGMSVPALALMCVVGVGVGFIYQAEKNTQGEVAYYPTHSPEAADVSSQAAPEIFREQSVATELAPTPAKESTAAIESASDTDAAGLQSRQKSITVKALPVPMVADSVVPDAVVSDSAIAEFAVPPGAKRERVDNAIAGVASLRDEQIQRLSVAAGNQWLSRQNSDSYIIRVATSGTLNALQDIAALVNTPMQPVLLHSGKWVLLTGISDSLSELQQTLVAIQSSGDVSFVDAEIVRVGEVQDLLK